MNVTLDIAALVSAAFWPLTVAAILIAYRKEVPKFAEGLFSRLNKVSVAGMSLELAQAKPFFPDWSSSPALDLRHQALGTQITDSSRAEFVKQLNISGTGDFAEINLGRGTEWLSSRLFIMSIIFSRMKGLKCFVFVETTESARRRYVGWVEPGKLRWALAKQYPWLEQAYADAYSGMQTMRNAVIVSHQGRLGYKHAPDDPFASVDLLKEFLDRVQSPALPQQPSVSALPASETEFVPIDQHTREHATWITAEDMENLLGADLTRAAIRTSDLKAMSSAGQLKAVLDARSSFVAIVEEDCRFAHLIRRDIVVEQMTMLIPSETKARA
jgi:hypothetical protein